MKKIIILATFLFTICDGVFAQGAFSFEKTEHNFGAISEGDLAEHIFKFTNTGDAPLVITDVRASCGCTTPEWPKEPIMPNETAEIKAIFNSSGRPGTFYKTITITSNAKENVKRLVIRGEVDRKEGDAPNSPNKDRKSQAKLEIEKPVFQFGKIKAGDQIQKSFVCKNTGQTALIIKGVQSECDCVKLVARKVIMPGQKTEIQLQYAPKHLKTDGEKVHLLTNATNEAQVSFTGEVVKSIVNKSPLHETSTGAF